MVKIAIFGCTRTPDLIALPLCYCCCPNTFKLSHHSCIFYLETDIDILPSVFAFATSSKSMFTAVNSWAVAIKLFIAVIEALL